MKPSEKRLIMLLLVLVALFATGFTTMRMLAWQRGLEKRERSQTMRREETQQLLAEAPMWEQKLQWLRKVQPPMKNVNTANSELDLLLNESLRKHGLQTDVREFVEDVKSDHFHQVGVTVRVNSEIKPLLNWMHELLAPDSFYFISKFTLTPMPEDNAKVSAELHVTRLYAPADKSTVEAAASPTPTTRP
ncbi:MAG: hypothetical protein IPK32_05655 [Verrucomicrobiaceae bacterium]|nr:hypothetical protein [Verrucomicrobiaceae bacterium]